MNAAPPFDAERLYRINALLDAALALPEEERAPWLDSLPPAQQPLIPALRTLLTRATEQTDTFMRRPAHLSAAGLADPDEPADSAGDRVGPYRLLRELGAGGMATVWLAERIDGAMQRQVALKLPRTDWASGLARRMARERDILAALEHPLIARLYDAGITDQGRPWLAMEYVSGVPIDVYCREFHLNLQQQLRLFLQVADAVAHAHARLVVHRDLKPTNILVTPEGDVRLLDFGVAKLLEEDLAPSSNLTQQMGRPVTPDYASPEQIGGRPVTVATDIYSMGIVLYELLTGSRPYRLGRPTAGAMEEAILAADVPRASTRVNKTNRRLARQMRGDLDTILVKALSKEPSHRYASVESMAADLQRHLQGEPVLAQPPSRWYRTRKFVLRNSVAITAGTAVATALLAGLGVALWQARAASHERELAYARLAQTEAVSEFVNAVLTESVLAAERITLKELMERSEGVADAAAHVMERAVAANAVAGWYAAYGDHAKAEHLLARTLAALPPSFDARLRATLQCQHAHAASFTGSIASALQAFSQAIAASRDDPATISLCLRLRGMARRNANDPKGALADLLEAQRLFEQAANRSPVSRALLSSELGYTYALNGEPVKAERHYTHALELLESTGRGESYLALTARTHWANTVLNSGDPLKALALLDQAQAFATRRAPAGGLPGYLWESRGRALQALARHGDAAKAYEQLIQSAQHQGSARSEAFGLVGHAAALHGLGMTDAAQAQLDAAQAKMRTAPAEPISLAHAHVQARVWQKQGRMQEAEARLTLALESAQAAALRASATVDLLIARSDLALAGKRPDKALADAEEALAVARDVQGTTAHSSVAGQAWFALANARHAAGRRTDARAAYANAAEHLVHTLGAAHPLAQLSRQRAASAH